MPGRFIEIEEGATAPELPKPQQEAPKTTLPEKHSHDRLGFIRDGGNLDLNPFFDEVFREAESLGAGMAMGFTQRFNQLEAALTEHVDTVFPTHSVNISIEKETPLSELLDAPIVKQCLTAYQLEAARQKDREAPKVLHPGDTWTFTLTSDIRDQTVRLTIHALGVPAMPRHVDASAPVPPLNHSRPTVLQRIARWFIGH